MTPASIGGFGDDDGHGVRECEEAAVEQLVVERAEREPVALFVSSSRGHDCSSAHRRKRENR
jgi:hypothetical protein